MRKLCAWLGVATLAVLASSTPAHAGDPLKPYVVFAFDTSGSMGSSTGSGSPSCGGADTRLNHARCAITRIVDSYGDMVFALGRFRSTMGGTTTAATFPTGCTLTGPGSSCTTSDDNFELLAPLVDGSNQAASAWTNLTGNTCTAVGTDPEIWRATGNTPIEGTLRGAKDYWQGLQSTTQTIWPSNLPGFAPIANDPTKTAFLPGGCDSSPTCTTNCCATQCRPYIVIMMTDGDETCGGTTGPTGTIAAAASSLLTTDVGGRRYRVLTKPIGFGIAAPNTNIENLAHAGGAADVPTANEGFYASDETGLQLAISSILDDAIRTEACNNLDDDCDSLIDEDFPTKGGACDNGKLGVCRRTGNLVCKADGTGLSCNAAVGPNGSAEICNNLDDNCNGLVDEGLTGCSCSPQGEQCNNADDDCDTRIDEGLTRPCGTGTCQGVESCAAGAFGGCTAQTPTTEICNGLDDNCDGVRDGFILGCSAMPPLPPENFAIDDPRNNPGDPSNSPIPENICHPGTKACPANVGPPNSFGTCLGEQQPRTEICNGLDDNCNNVIDEGTGGADCSSSCGIGTTVCLNGVITCNAVPATNDDTCDGNDDDCDGNIDEDYVCDTPPNCPCTAAGQCNAVQSCVNGAVVCQGDTIAAESCDCNDNDCDGNTDEGALCAGGATCTNCQCAFPCSTEEIQCALGKVCKDNFCIADPCFGVVCGPVNGNAQVCQVNAQGNDHACVDACSVTNCAPLICLPATGECAPDDCRTFPDRCAANQNCVVDGTGVASCVTNPCQGINCPTDQYCVAGECHGTCVDVDCPTGQRCRLGVCESDPCGHPCPFGLACNDSTGVCITDGCPNKDCPQGQWCNPNHDGGTCEPDPCVGTSCPNPGEVCRGGSCFNPQDFLPDAGAETHVTTGGGGGCSTTGSGAGLLVGLALLLRRRKGGRA